MRKQRIDSYNRNHLLSYIDAFLDSHEIAEAMSKGDMDTVAQYVNRRNKERARQAYEDSCNK